METKPTIETVLERLSAYTSSLDLNPLDLEQLKADLENCLRELQTSLGICPDTHETDLEVNNLIIELGLLNELEEKLQKLEKSFKPQGSGNSGRVKTILQQMLQIVRQKKDQTEKAVQEIEHCISEGLESTQSHESSQPSKSLPPQQPPVRGMGW